MRCDFELPRLGPARAVRAPLVWFAAIALVAGIVRAQDAPGGIEVGQLNYRMTVAEQQFQLAKQQTTDLSRRLALTTQKLEQLEQRFSQLVTLLDRMHREQQETIERLQKQLERPEETEKPGPPPSGAPKEPAKTGADGPRR